MSNTQLSQSSSLDDWLFHLENLHYKEIDMGLERVKHVGDIMSLTHAHPAKIILIAGTNGKGTTARFLEHALRQQGKSVGTFVSPHIERYNERVRINGEELDDEGHCKAFYEVESARGETPLTYFEFGALAGLHLFKSHQVEYVLLEVGLGGRLDATNIVSPIASVITTIDLDHQAFLGNTREKVGLEKAGVYRRDTPAIMGDIQPPKAVINYTNELGAHLVQATVDYDYTLTDSVFSWHFGNAALVSTKPHIPAQNVATGLALLKTIGLLPSQSQFIELIDRVKVEGRMQFVSERPTVVLDVAHNPQSAAYLAKQISALKPNYANVYALIGMLKDKDQKAALSHLIPELDGIYTTLLDTPRSTAKGELTQVLADLGTAPLAEYQDVPSALGSILPKLQAEDLLIVMGSFYTVQGALSYFNNKR